MADITNDYNDDEKQQRLNEIHSKRTSSEDTIQAIVNKALNKQALGYDRIIAGEVNEVYLLHFQDSDDLILRIGHNESRTFASETWAIEQAGKAGVPVAKILATDTIQSDGKLLSYSLQEKILGERFDTLLWTKQIEPSRAQRITERAGEVLAKIHSVTTTSGYGNINEQGKGQFATLDDWVQSHAAKQEEYERLFKLHNMNDSTFEAVIAKLRTATDCFDKNPHLLHVDYGPKHIFVDESDNITGVIDFERAESGDIATDFASWDFWFNTMVPTQWLYDGYQRISSLGKNFDTRLEIVKLNELLHLLRYYTDVAPIAEAATNSARDIEKIVFK
jgi:aminoglycoside phosphotransferase (APT) family kinase protein